nr:probable nadph:quinone reductase, zeta-crystallin homolog oxidoreductase protein [uncultured Gammaproteobacteria bacterium]
MVQAVRISRTGGPEVMALEEVQLEPPGPGMVTVANRAIGLNYIDTYHRSGLYPLPLPTGIGLEGAGEIQAVGEGVTLREGDRVAYCSAGFGAYAQALNLPAARLVKIPEDISFEQAAAVLLKGQTTEYLLQRTYPLQPGETCLFHAAAGGVGLLFGQWAKSIGANVIGTVGSDEKARLALAHGFAHVINYRTEDVVQRVLEITGGEKVPVVYDGVGRDTFDISLDCLRPRGLMVSFGNASGAPDPLNLQILANKGSLFLTRPTMLTYTATEEELQQSSRDVFSRVLSGDVKIEINQRYPLADVQQAHRDLESRKTSGSTVLLP